MSWHVVAARGAGVDLWVEVAGEGKPRYGVWETTSGQDVCKVLGEHGPEGLDVAVWWQQVRDNRGSRLVDMLWDVGGLGLKVVSTKMCALLQSVGGNLQVFDIDLRMRNGQGVEGYVGVLEEIHHPGPVHSLWRGTRSNGFVVSGDVLKELQAADLVGLDVRPVDEPFPADRPGFFDREE